jgi:hypothetical protein
MDKRRCTEAEFRLASKVWTEGWLPIGSEERRLVSAFIAHPHAHVTEEQSEQLAMLAARLRLS